MDRKDAYRRLANVVNLTDGVKHAERVVAAANGKVTKAKTHLDAAKASKTKATDALEVERARLADAQALAAEIPAEMVEGLVTELGAKRATRARYVEALASDDGSEEHRAAVLAAAEAAGATAAFAQVAEGNGEGNGV